MKITHILAEERRGRRRAHRMAREVAGFVKNPVNNTLSFAGNTLSSVAGEDMSGGAKVLMLLLGAGVVGGGIYYLTTKPAAAATPTVTPTAVTATTPGTIPVPTIAQIQATGATGPTAGTTVATMVQNALNLVSAGQPAVGADWVAWAKQAGGLTAAQLGQLRAAGYAV